MKRFSLILFFFLSFSPANSAELLLFEQEGCEWCEEWHKEVGVSYLLTQIGKRIPLRRLDIGDPVPSEITLSSGIVFTPTFVLVENRKEIGRILGFFSEYQFWSLMEDLEEKLVKTGS